eukprot:343356-Alexandrium_andersonii.AAC.1
MFGVATQLFRFRAGSGLPSLSTSLRSRSNFAESYNVADYAEREFQWTRLLHVDQMLMAKPRK